MKNILLFLLIALCGIVLIPRELFAFDEGDCYACHAEFQRETVDGKMATVTCVECHTSEDGNILKKIGGVTVPTVVSASEPGASLAGGNFFYVKFRGMERGHNVQGVVPGIVPSAPPGYDRRSDTSSIGFNAGKPLVCAGSNGCHGDRDVEDEFEAMKGSHHSKGTPVDGSTKARSFRFLKNTRDAKGVTGLEDPDWGMNSTPAKHNEYTLSMNRFCMNCHGAFFSTAPQVTETSMGLNNPHKNHPTAVVIPDNGEFKNYNPDVPPAPGGRLYSLEAPVARERIPAAPRRDVIPGQDYVFCLSCHMPHASPYPYGLRWDYSKMIAGGKRTGGCFICHTEKGKAADSVASMAK